MPGTTQTGSHTIQTFKPNRPIGGRALTAREKRLAAMLSQGGDARITLDPASGLNRYLSAPYPRDVLAYSSSTVSDISRDAFDHLLALDWEARSYSGWLGEIAARLRAAFAIESQAAIVFAPSGTDLEYVALAAVLEKGAGGIHNILLGADEIGSGCIHSARGRYFANETALGIGAHPTGAINGLDGVTLADIPVRCDAGKARSSAAISAAMREEIAAARQLGRHCLVHGVHGSKTGLVLPDLSDLAALQSEFAGDVTFVIDACQARITGHAVRAYLERGCIVLMTGSKFVGAPPFNGWALVPADLAATATPLPAGFATNFRRSEWPEIWAGRDQLEDSANIALALRLEAAIFEIERFQAVDAQRLAGLIANFQQALDEELAAPLGARRVEAGHAAPEMPIEMRTLATLDMSHLPGFATFDDAQSVHRQLALDGIRLGQPVKCVALPQGWGGTLRIGLSMPQLTVWSHLSPEQARGAIREDMRRIKQALQVCTREAIA